MDSGKEWELPTAEKYYPEEEQKEEINCQHRSQFFVAFSFLMMMGRAYVTWRGEKKSGEVSVFEKKQWISESLPAG